MIFSNGFNQALRSALGPHCFAHISKTYLYNFDPLKRHFYSNEYRQSMFWAEIWNISDFFLSENYQFLEVKFSIYLKRCVFVMRPGKYSNCSNCQLAGDLYGVIFFFFVFFFFCFFLCFFFFFFFCCCCFCCFCLFVCFFCFFVVVFLFLFFFFFSFVFYVCLFFFCFFCCCCFFFL